MRGIFESFDEVEKSCVERFLDLIARKEKGMRHETSPFGARSSCSQVALREGFILPCIRTTQHHENNLVTCACHNHSSHDKEARCSWIVDIR